jgi:UDP-N-acetylglucosamine--N-acetylmuramyl-(pentapeptide) pyrophosphoryl-undecaprenol N-acetylglucosamine transferase
MRKELSSIVFAGGGTLGHLFAGLAVADAMHGCVPSSSLHFVGLGVESERKHVEGAGYGYHAIACSPWPRRPWAAGNFFISNLCGYLNARRMLRELRAGVVVGLGGYASAPVARAAVSLAIPLVLLEQNAVPGRVNRWLSRYAVCICASFPSPSAWRSNKVYVTGNPIRRGFHSPVCVAGGTPAFYRAAETPTPQIARRERLLVITGGSQGAAALNAAVPAALGKCQPLLDGWRIVHQSGPPR